MKRSHVIAVALGLTALLPISRAYAHGYGDMHETLVQRIAQKFGLQQSSVQAVFDDVRKERQAEMQKRLEDRLTQAVKDGKLTDAQKNLILAKHKEMQANREKNRDAWMKMSPEERRNERQKTRAELEAWAKANNIPLEWVMPYGRGGMGMGRWK